MRSGAKLLGDKPEGKGRQNGKDGGYDHCWFRAQGFWLRVSLSLANPKTHVARIPRGTT